MAISEIVSQGGDGTEMARLGPHGGLEASSPVASPDASVQGAHAEESGVRAMTSADSPEHAQKPVGGTGGEARAFSHTPTPAEQGSLSHVPQPSTTFHVPQPSTYVDTRAAAHAGPSPVRNSGEDMGEGELERV